MWKEGRRRKKRRRRRRRRKERDTHILEDMFVSEKPEEELRDHCYISYRATASNCQPHDLFGGESGSEWILFLIDKARRMEKITIACLGSLTARLAACCLTVDDLKSRTDWRSLFVAATSILCFHEQSVCFPQISLPGLSFGRMDYILDFEL